MPGIGCLARAEKRHGYAALAAITLALGACWPIDRPPQRTSYSGVVKAGTLQNPVLREASGLAASVRRNDLLWTINDSGQPILYALGLDGGDQGQLRINADIVDWEDLASFRLDGKPYLLIADTGDNARRRVSGTLYVVEEPNLADGGSAIEPAWKIRFSFPDGARDCESVAVDVAGEQILLLSKRTVPAELYVLPLRPMAGDAEPVLVATRLGIIDSLPQPSVEDLIEAPTTDDYHWQPAAMDISADSGAAVILTYGEAYYYERRAGEAWIEVFTRSPTRLGLPSLEDAEAVSFATPEQSIFVTTEQRYATLFRFDPK